MTVDSLGLKLALYAGEPISEDLFAMIFRGLI